MEPEVFLRVRLSIDEQLLREAERPFCMQSSPRSHHFPIGLQTHSPPGCFEPKGILRGESQESGFVI